MKRLFKKIRHIHLGFLVLILVLLVGLVTTVLLTQQQQRLNSQAQAVPSNIQVNFSQPIVTLAPFAFSGTISTYGSTGNIISSQKQRDNLQKLGLGMYRIPLRWNGGNIVSSAGGHPAGSGDAWVNAIRSIGGEPMIVIGGDEDNNFSPQDAANLVRHFSGANKVAYWVIGNEPDNQGMGMGQYCTIFNNTVAAMKAVDPTIKVAGPALVAYEDYKHADYDTFLNCAGNSVDIVDFHSYGERAQGVDWNVTNWAEAYEGKVKDLRARINRLVPNRANQIEIQVGEWNLAPVANGDNDPRFYGSGQVVFSTLAAGSMAKAGARGHQYSDQNNPLGITFENQSVASQFGKTVADPLPIYHGIGMFTGEGLFRKFGTQMVQATTSLQNITVFASTNGKNIVVVNKSPTAEQQATIQLTGFGQGTVSIWQTNPQAPFDAPTNKGTQMITSYIPSTMLPPYSVTTFVLDESATPIATTVPTDAPTETAIPTLFSTPTPIQSVPTEVPLPTATPTPVVLPGILQATTPLALNKSAVATGETLTGTVSYKNVGGKALVLRNIVIAVRPPGGTNAGGPYLDLMPAKGKVIVSPGQTVTLSASRTISVTDPRGQWYAYSTYEDAAGYHDDARTSFFTVLAQKPTSVPVVNGSGLTGSYYPNTNFNGSPSLVRIDPMVNFGYGAGGWGSKAPASNLPKDNFSVRWSGYVVPKYSQEYTFYTKSDDGVRLWVNGVNLVNNWKNHSSTENSGKITLQAGQKYTISMEYYDSYVDAIAELYWSSASQAKQIVPTSQLFPLF